MGRRLGAFAAVGLWLGLASSEATWATRRGGSVMRLTWCAIAVVGVSYAVLGGTASADDHEDGSIILDRGTATLFEVPALQSSQVLLWSGLPLVGPTDAVLEPDGTILIIDPDADQIFRFDRTAGTLVAVADSPFDSCWVVPPSHPPRCRPAGPGDIGTDR